MNAITLLIVIVCFIVGAALIFITATNFGMIFFTTALVVAITGHAGVRAPSPSTLSDSPNPLAAQYREGNFGSNMEFYCIFPDSQPVPAAVDAENLDAGRMMKKAEFGDDFAVVNTGVAIQAQIGALFATDVQAPARASQDSVILASIAPPF
jgi:hypothetical protein